MTPVNSNDTPHGPVEGNVRQSGSKDEDGAPPRERGGNQESPARPGEGQQPEPAFVLYGRLGYVPRTNVNRRD